MKLVHWLLMGVLLHLVQRGGDWVGPQPAQALPRCTKCNSSPINGQCTNHCVFCSFNVLIKGLTYFSTSSRCEDAVASPLLKHDSTAECRQCNCVSNNYSLGAATQCSVLHSYFCLYTWHIKPD